MKIYLATWLTDRSLGSSLTKKKAPRRLLSYYFLIEQQIDNFLFKEYNITGRCDPRKIKDI
jgi:hypothetical protein